MKKLGKILFNADLQLGILRGYGSNPLFLKEIWFRMVFSDLETELNFEKIFLILLLIRKVSPCF